MAVGASPVALVTGAAGGVGRAVVEALRNRGYDVLAVDVAESVMELAADSADGRRIVSQVVDVREDDASAECMDAAEREFGRLDLLVNNAGRFLQKPIAEVTTAEFDELFAINARSAFLHARDALPLLRRGGGSIVNVASTSGFVGVAGQSVYAMTKGAIVQLTRQLAIEEASRGVRVNAVAPGAIDTDFTAAVRAADPDPEDARARSLARHPIGRYSTASEVAAAICFLASDDASAITGTILSVDGGYLAQ
jgi:NAD(P)-dependent dehydrogenase (short-subunit alcohol dehydrogenase family)